MTPVDRISNKEVLLIQSDMMALYDVIETGNWYFTYEEEDDVSY